MITTGNNIVSIYTEMTPNPETMKFVANKLLYPGKSLDISEEALATASPLAKELFSFPFIKSVFIASNFITLTKTTTTEDWQDVIPTIKTFLKEYLEVGGIVVNEEEVLKMKKEATQMKPTSRCVCPSKFFHEHGLVPHDFQPLRLTLKYKLAPFPNQE